MRNFVQVQGPLAHMLQLEVPLSGQDFLVDHLLTKYHERPKAGESWCFKSEGNYKKSVNFYLEDIFTNRTEGTPKYVKYYLVAYNALSALGWSYVLITLSAHLLGLPLPFSLSSSAASANASGHTASSKLSSFFSQLNLNIEYIPYLKPRTPALASYLPKALVPVLRRATTAYAAVGPATAFVQTAAVLEVLHAWLGWVRSPVQTTLMQVSSRLFLVWGVTEQFEVVRSASLFTSRSAQIMK